MWPEFAPKQTLGVGTDKPPSHTTLQFPENDGGPQWPHFSAMRVFFYLTLLEFCK